MKNNLNVRFYQRYFTAINSEAMTSNTSRNHADWLSWVPVQYRLDILSRLMQCDIDSLDDEKYRQHL